jgi:Cation transporter/ATPase, N-terminus
MQGSSTSQQAPPGEEKTGTQTVPLKKLFEQLKSSEQGLTNAEARKQLGSYSPNDMTGLKHTSPVVQFLRLFANPLIAILLVVSVVSAFLGDPVDAIIIIVIGPAQQHSQLCPDVPIAEQRREATRECRPHSERAPRWHLAGTATPRAGAE